MGSYVRFAAAAAALSLAGCAYVETQVQYATWSPEQAALLACHGDFGQFANGYPVNRPMELDFAAYWTIPAIYPLNGGSQARIIALNSLEVSFEVQYEGYRVAYHLDRVKGTFSQRPNLGGIYFGRCDLRPLTTRI